MTLIIFQDIKEYEEDFFAQSKIFKGGIINSNQVCNHNSAKTEINAPANCLNVRTPTKQPVVGQKLKP